MKNLLELFLSVRVFFNFPGMILKLYRHRELIISMTKRDFTLRYHNSFGGIFWSIIQPLFLMIIYTLVFSFFLKVRFSEDASPFSFSIYLLCGLLPWTAFSEGLSSATGVIRANVNLVKRVVFPLEILPINLVLKTSLEQVIGLFLLLPLIYCVNGRLYWTILSVPLILVLQVLFAMGMNWFIAGIAAYLPDFEQFIAIVLLGGMFLTPIFYPVEMVPQEALILFKLNPMAYLVNLYRDALMNGRWPSLHNLFAIWLFVMLIFTSGYSCFIRLQKGFADVL